MAAEPGRCRAQLENRVEHHAHEQPEAERTKEVSGEDENERVVPNEATNSIIGSDWSSVSPEQASQYMAIKTGVGASKWLDIIYKESSGNPYSDKKRK